MTGHIHHCYNRKLPEVEIPELLSQRNFICDYKNGERGCAFFSML
jgi:hypothetical protein